MYRFLSSRVPLATSAVPRALQAPTVRHVAPVPLLSPRNYFASSSPTFEAEKVLEPNLVSPDQREIFFDEGWPRDFSGEMVCLKPRSAEPQRLEMIAKKYRVLTKKYFNYDEESGLVYIRTPMTPLHNAISDAFWRETCFPGIPNKVHVQHRQVADCPIPAFTSHMTYAVDSRPNLVLAVALSQPRKYLHNGVEGLYKKQPELENIVTIHIDEKTSYMNPIDANGYTKDDARLDERVREHYTEMYSSSFSPGTTDKPFALTAAKIERDAFADVYLENPDDPHSALCLYGMRWVDEMTADVQLWRGPSKLPTEPTVFYGRDHEETSTLCIPESATVPMKTPKWKHADRPILYDWSKWRIAMDNARRALARDRYVAAVMKLAEVGEKKPRPLVRYVRKGARRDENMNYRSKDYRSNVVREPTS